MSLIVLAALDLAVVRSRLSGRSLTGILLVMGALPVANLLVLGLLPLVGPRESRKTYPLGLLRLELGGFITVALYTACAVYWPSRMLDAVVGSLVFVRPYGNGPFLASVGVALVLPQLTLALFAAWISGRRAIALRLAALCPQLPRRNSR